MTPAAEVRLIWSGCLVALIGTCVFGYLAVTLHWAYGAMAVLPIPIWGFVSRQRGKVAERANQEALREIFHPAGCAMPIVGQGSDYGFPTFTLVFSSKAECDAAERAGCIAAFKAFVQTRYAHLGGSENPFDAERAVEVTYERARGVK